MPDRGHYAIEEDKRRASITWIIGIVAITVLLGVALLSLIKGDVRVALIDFGAAGLLITLVSVFRFTDYKDICRYVSVMMMYCLYLYLFSSGAADGTTYMWHYTFPFFTIFLIGANHGAIASLLLFIPVFIIVIRDAISPETGMYTSFFATRFIPSLLVALVFAYIFEKERERFHRQARKAYAEQESIIEERTLQLTREIEERDRIAEKLRQSQKMEAIGTMASGVAHDLNNILAGIVTYPELLRSNLPPGSSLERPLRLIEQAGKRAAAVVSDLLTIARNAASVKEEFDVHEVIREILQSPEWQIVLEQNPEVSIKVDLGARNVIVNGSQTHVRKSLMNLVLNGVEATTVGGAVSITTFNDKESGIQHPIESDDVEKHEIVIQIRDDGQGIPIEHVEHIFEPFYTTKKMGRSGSGLGLSVVWNTVEEHGGSISVENTHPGALFELRLPVVKDYTTGRLATTKTVISSFRGTETILVVDDEPALREIACGILEKLGYNVLFASSGEEALEKVIAGNVDLVLLDMILGEGIGGYETYLQMKGAKPDQKAVIVSGFSTSEDVSKVMALGASSIVKKPYTIEELGSVIKQCFES